MFGDIGAAAIYGGIGGGLGGLLGYLIGQLFRNTKFAQMASTGFAVLGLVVGMNIAEPLLEPYTGKYLGSGSTSAVDKQFDEMVVELKSFPLMAAIIEKDPAMLDGFREKMEEVSKEATTPAIARQMGFSAGYNFVVEKFGYYMARGTDADLRVMTTTTVELLNDLSVRDPRFCFDYLFNPAGISNLGLDEMKAKVGLEMFDRQQQEGATLVRNSFDTIPAYDVAAANEAMQEIALPVLAMLGDKVGLFTGAIVAKTDADATLACEATSALYTSALAREDAILIIRHMFVSAAG